MSHECNDFVSEGVENVSHKPNDFVSAGVENVSLKCNDFVSKGHHHVSHGTLSQMKSSLRKNHTAAKSNWIKEAEMLAIYGHIYLMG